MQNLIHFCTCNYSSDIIDSTSNANIRGENYIPETGNHSDEFEHSNNQSSKLRFSCTT